MAPASPPITSDSNWVNEASPPPPPPIVRLLSRFFPLLDATQFVASAFLGVCVCSAEVDLLPVAATLLLMQGQGSRQLLFKRVVCVFVCVCCI